MLYRQATLADMGAVVKGLWALKPHADKYAFVASTSLRKAQASIEHAILTNHAFVVDGYLVLIDVMQPWFSEDTVLQEWFVMKLYDGGTVANIPPTLMRIASDLGCKIVITADSSPVQIVATAYKQAGFHPLTQSFCQKV